MIINDLAQETGTPWVYGACVSSQGMYMTIIPQELVIELEGKGGHAAYPHLAEDMVVAASSLVTQMQSIVARNVDPLDSAVITIGTITGGSAQNIIAQEARLEGTIRTLSPASMEQVKKRKIGRAHV